MKKLKYLALVLIAVLALAACGKSEEAEEENTESVEVEETTEEEAEEQVQEPVKLFGVFDTQTLEGEPVTEEIFGEADLTMVNIWGTFCGPCIEEMPYLGELSREYADRGFQIVGMVCDVTEAGNETALQIVEETKADYTNVIASEDLMMNALQYVSSVPTTVFLGKEGNVVGEVYSGARDKTTWELIINQYLAEVK
jgi:thiol-disulfide isomerase/thioredoxin